MYIKLIGIDIYYFVATQNHFFFFWTQYPNFILLFRKDSKGFRHHLNHVMPEAISTRKYSVVRAIKSFTLAALHLENESPMQWCFLEIVILARSFWLRCYGCLQDFNCDIIDLGRKPRMAFLMVAIVGPAVPGREKWVLEPVKWLWS